MTLHHPPGRYGSAKSFWITSFVVPDDGPSSSSSQDGQRTHTGDIPQIFERQRSVNLTGITGLTLFYGFDRQHHRGLLCKLGDERASSLLNRNGTEAWETHPSRTQHSSRTGAPKAPAGIP